MATYSVTITFDSAEEAAAYLSASDAPTTTAAPEKPKTAKAKAEKPAPVEEPESQFTYEEVSAKVMEVVKAKGRDAGVNLLGQFKQADGSAATKGAQVLPADYDAFMEKAAEALAEDDLG